MGLGQLAGDRQSQAPPRPARSAPAVAGAEDRAPGRPARRRRRRRPRARTPIRRGGRRSRAPRARAVAERVLDEVVERAPQVLGRGRHRRRRGPHARDHRDAPLGARRPVALDGRGGQRRQADGLAGARRPAGPSAARARPSSPAARRIVSASISASPARRSSRGSSRAERRADAPDDGERAEEVVDEPVERAPRPRQASSGSRRYPMPQTFTTQRSPPPWAASLRRSRLAWLSTVRVRAADAVAPHVAQQLALGEHPRRGPWRGRRGARTPWPRGPARGPPSVARRALRSIASAPDADLLAQRRPAGAADEGAEAGQRARGSGTAWRRSRRRPRSMPRTAAWGLASPERSRMGMPASQGSSAPPSRMAEMRSRPLMPGRPTSMTAASGWPA